MFEFHSDRNSHIRTQLENRVAYHGLPLFIGSLVSMAISLKRIADSLKQIEKGNYNGK
jgi:hypothetical protein